MFGRNKIKQANTKSSPSQPISPPDKKVIKENLAKERELLEEEKIFREGIVSVRDIISPTALKIESNFLQLNNLYARTLFVMTYPRYVTIGWFAPIINESMTLDISMFFHPLDIQLVLKQLRNKVGTMEAQIIADNEKGAPRDPISETALRDIEGLRDALSQGTEKFFQFALYITIYAKDKSDLDLASDRVENLLGTQLIYSRRALFQSEQGFNSTLPLGNDELAISTNMNSSPIASSFPFVSSELTSDNGVLYGINRHNNSLILFDRFSLQNANAVVFATSGAGKSYAIKLEVLRSLMLGTDVIIVDPENEYQHLSEAVGGAYINVSLNSESKLNPFDLPKGIGGDAKPEDILRSAVITLKGLIRLMIGEITNVEDSLLDRALLETYAKKDITSSSDLANIEPPLMSDLEEVLLSMEGGEDMALRIKKYTEGTFSGLFNNPTNVQVDNQLIVFCIRDLEDELRPIAMYVIMNYIWNLVRSELKKRILIVDEAWIMMRHEDSAKFMFALVKRCRKYYMGITTITQDVNDFLTSAFGNAIVTNSSMQLLLKQSPAAVGLIQKTFMLTEGEKYLLLESGVGEGIFFAGAKHAAIKIQASYAEHQIITSDPRQLLEIEEAKKEFEESILAEAENGGTSVNEVGI
ncbi:MAG: conjugal transfer protein TraC [Candidatus Komeilibacteria bacterium CG11_big_fil_rev_8_21_14_0_20_36_20]|uniref:Conjugal transfer protein TraC n=1 Tax=Candidatus Komeilibacteria bacterium CG11_big_fil_rev_8_21_14_0_20_36_20 TaxID=1974477 RepID=A0A2H0NCV7_9BACT|nr:MAG: conjugal transfer protein TraC [Candidatus Komeilibacteria bacterium CG11_big_fil_rev_8_21_14_0_20_36_20]PIR81499.1 MAG: conjugal transfer protein TraC [Candidatus Komeilibacteria bacterium CG10_big_fil_rev_8_21_14_0_10_36_65]PJC55725.1 MAG: conjugal transfer protein TraC [Candidatus Komeilibacteria bacterium CG_4_9_14_0_2_um_filter_36_13]